MSPKAKWTILTYIAAHNNLSALGNDSLDQILQVGSSPDVVHGVLYDGPDGAARYILGDPGAFRTQEELGDFDSADPVRLVETAKWVYDQYPAENYGLILWSHGSGWQPHEIQQVAAEVRKDKEVDQQEAAQRSGEPGSLALFRTTIAQIVKPVDKRERAVLFDDGTQHSLDTLELEKVMRALQESAGQPIGLLGIDACLMATLEVGYQVRNSVECLVASEELVPGHSWPYDSIFAALRGNPALMPNELATLVVKDYTAFYTAHPPNVGDVTKVALDLRHIDKLAGPVSDLAAALKADMDNQADLMWKAQVNTQKKETRNGLRLSNKFRYYLWDVRTVAEQLAQLSANEAVKGASQAVVQAMSPGGPAVLAEGHYGGWFDGIGGVSIFLMPPKMQDRLSPFYADLDFACDTHWNEMLQAYHQHYP